MSTNFDTTIECIQETSVKFDLGFFEVIALLTQQNPDFQKNLFESYERDVVEAGRWEYKFDPSSNYRTENTNLLHTGARPGEVIIGCGKQSKDTVIAISGGLVPPDRRALSYLFNHLDEGESRSQSAHGRSQGRTHGWVKFIRGLSSIEFFQGLTPVEREIWLWVHQDSGELDNYLEDIPEVLVEVLQIGGTKECAFVGLGEEAVERISTIGKVPAKEIAGMFKGKPGSGGLQGRHTLIFRRGNWKLSSIYHDVSGVPEGELRGVLFDISSDASPSSSSSSSSSQSTVQTRTLSFDSFAGGYAKTTKGYTVSKTQTVFIKFDTLFSRLDENELFRLASVSEAHADTIRNACKAFTAASYKSAFQKFIRFRSGSVSFGDKPKGGKVTIPTNSVAKALFVLLVCHPGGFVPDIQRYVGGVESAFKRLAVIAHEDSYFDIKRYGRTVRNFTIAAYLAQRVPGWKPSTQLVQSALDFIEVILEEPRAFIYHVDKGAQIEKYVIRGESGERTQRQCALSDLQTISAFIEELKSFQGDMNMIRYIASKGEKCDVTRHTPRPITVEWCHLVDQHFAPEIAYFFPVNLIDSHAVKGSKPFSKLFGRLFNEVTGINPRRTINTSGKPGKDTWSETFEAREFVKIVRIAQKRFLATKQGDSSLYFSHGSSQPDKAIPRPTKQNFSYELDRGLIAGMMGSIHIKGKEPALVSLHPENPEIFIAVANPSRNMKSPILTPKREADVIKQVFEKMKKFGVPLSACKAPLKEMQYALLFVSESSTPSKIEYLIRLKSGKIESWETYRKGTIKLPMVEGGDDLAERIITSKYTRSHVQRLLSYISNHSSLIQFKHIGRDGGGTQGAVSASDAGAYQLLSELVDIYPSALEKVSGNILDFKVIFSPLMRHIVTVVNHSLNVILRSSSGHVSTSGPSSSSSSGPSSASSMPTKWINFGEADTREMREYQTESVEAMAHAHNSGRKGSFVNIDTGRGKTKIVLEYMKWLLHNGSLPDYVIYTLPDSAFESVITEIKMFGADYVTIIPTKGKRSRADGSSSSSSSTTIRECVPRKYHINLIEHDHLRLCPELSDYAGESLFVIDEVHKALRESLRTDHALTLSNLSVEFVAMTATPVIDTNTYRLMWWLSQISPFEVTDKNFFVSAAGMINKKSILPAKEIREEIYVHMTKEEERAYALLVPPALGGTNANPRNEDFTAAFGLCYTVTTRGMINDVLHSPDSSKSRAFIVAKDKAHQSEIVSLLVKKGVPSHQIFQISKGNSIFFTDESVEAGVTPDYRFVVTTQRYSSGYTLTRLNVMVTGVYPSNQATREQLDGRINRIGQRSSIVTYKIYHTGLLTYTLQRYKDAKNLSDVMKRLASDL